MENGFEQGGRFTTILSVDPRVATVTEIRETADAKEKGGLVREAQAWNTGRGWAGQRRAMPALDQSVVLTACPHPRLRRAAVLNVA